jgi:hypothetical protein
MQLSGNEETSYADMYVYTRTWFLRGFRTICCVIVVFTPH